MYKLVYLTNTIHSFFLSYQDPKDEQWRRAMEYVSMVSELNYMSQVVILLYEDPTKDPNTEERYVKHPSFILRYYYYN